MFACRRAMLDLNQAGGITDTNLANLCTRWTTTNSAQLPHSAFNRFQQGQIAALRDGTGARCGGKGTKARKNDVGEFHFHMLLDRKP